MAHFEKYTQSGARQTLKHDERKFTDKRENIDKSLSCNNYNLEPRHDPWQFVKDKIAMSKNTGGRVNTRTIACCSCVVTLPKDFDGDERLFFETAKKHLDGVFGRDNCISAWVHYDEPESRPHLHYKATPILANKDDKGNPTGVLQFNAKKVVNRAFLKQFHKNLDKAMTTVFGRSVGILNGVCSDGALTVPQLKKQREMFLQLNKDYNSLLDEYNELIDDYNNLLDDIESLQSKRDELSLKVGELKERLDKMKEENARLADEILGDDDFDFGR